jgi:arsenite methyltransferase
MGIQEPGQTDLDIEELREAIQQEYDVVAREPEQGFHFHTGRPLARMLDYDDAWLEGVPEGSIASFAGTGNPFRLGPMLPGEHVVDVGSGAGLDSLIAAHMVGPAGRVIGVDMTPAMLARARQSSRSLSATKRRVSRRLCRGAPSSRWLGGCHHLEWRP